MFTRLSVCQPCALSLLCTLSLLDSFLPLFTWTNFFKLLVTPSVHPSTWAFVPWRQCLTGQGVPIFTNQYKPRRSICLSLTLEEDRRKDNLPLAPHILKVLPITPNPYHSGSRTKTRVSTAQKNVRSTFFMSDQISMHCYPNCGCWKEMDKWKKKKRQDASLWISALDIWGIQMELRDEFTKCVLGTWVEQVFMNSGSETTVLHRHRLGV